MSEHTARSLVFIRAFISALGQSSGITFTLFGSAAAPSASFCTEEETRGDPTLTFQLFVVLHKKRNFLLEKKTEGRSRIWAFTFVWGLKIEHILSHLFVFYIQNNSFLIALASLFSPKRQETHFFPSTIHLKWRWWRCWTGHLGLTPAKQSPLLVTVWEPFISLFVIGGFSVLLPILWLITRPNMAPRSINMDQINFFSSGHLCGGKKVIQLKVINLQSSALSMGGGGDEQTTDR